MIHKLARPLLRGVPLQILNGKLKQNVKNRMVNDLLKDYPNFTGEAVVGLPTAEDCYEETQRMLDQPNAFFLFVFWVYDLRTTALYSLQDRLKIAESMVTACGPTVQFADHELIESEKELEAYKEKVIVQAGYPGIVLREPYGTFGTEDETITA